MKLFPTKKLALMLATCFVSGLALASPEADVEVKTNLSNIQIQFGGGGNGSTSGCNANSCERWDTVHGRCSKPRLITKSTASQSITCRNGDGATRSGSVSRTTEVYGWTLPPNGSQSNSYTYTYYSGTYCPSGYGVSSLPSNSHSPNPSSACKVSSNRPNPPTVTIPPPTPKPDPPPSGGSGGGSSGGGSGARPPAGSTEVVTLRNELICNSSNPNYSAGIADNTTKNRIITTYKNLNYLGRCPELDGYKYWQADHVNKNEKDWVKTELAIKGGNNSGTIADSINIANSLCASAAKKYVSHSFVSAVYVNGTGNQCRVTY